MIRHTLPAPRPFTLRTSVVRELQCRYGAEAWACLTVLRLMGLSVVQRDASVVLRIEADKVCGGEGVIAAYEFAGVHWRLQQRAGRLRLVREVDGSVRDWAVEREV